MTDFENDLLKKLLYMKSEEVKKKYKESGNEGFKEIMDKVKELSVLISCSKRW